MKEGEALLPAPPPESRELKHFGGKCLDVYAIFFYYVFYAMEDTGLLRIDNPVDVIALHLTFVPRIND